MKEVKNWSEERFRSFTTRKRDFKAEPEEQVITEFVKEKKSLSNLESHLYLKDENSLL